MEKNNYFKDNQLFLAVVCVLFFLIRPAHAQLNAEYYYKNWRLPPYTTAIISKGSSRVRELHAKNNLSEKELILVEQLKTLVSIQSVLAFLLIDENDQIIFEMYNHGASESSLLQGHSMTKSLVSIIVGEALCDGSIKSIDDKAEMYSSALKGTAYGDATIRQLLMMSSTGSKSVIGGNPEQHSKRDLEITHRKTLRTSFREFGINQPNPAQAGVFAYKGLDTAALSIAVADVKKTKFQNVLTSHLWSRIGAERNAEIVVDKNNDAIAKSGFGATARDWGRLAIYARNQVKSNTCIGNYLKEAMRGKIINNSETGQSFQKYGYQFWTDNKFITVPSAWMNGYGGQLIGIDLVSGKIALLFSYALGANVKTYRLFEEWTR